ncbi:DNA topoisomerase 3 (plasmid) [Clostridium perfringens]|uniref:DNA topoisomerase 3 n=1 Tax=Clostridium perfringens TaxID=1502 RepID=UPI00224688E3|nr:DNA topoisomerase 3 [Clostridium perfringens]EGT4141284.1 DNA topoisomerase III [Clostridium perfringens]MCX0366872.1 DNA topoisomerase 3 [Clostridium perfringens]MCX0403541.1 DNA topoisomerase 3 [Clostridium perfringens]
MKLIITEKPAVACDIGKVLKVNTRKDGYLEGNNYVITWCVGHLIQLAYPGAYDEKYNKWTIEDLPIIPEKFITEVNKSTSKQYYTIKKLMFRDDIDEIICATDSAREGELIFRYVYNEAKCNKPVKRLWISSQTERAIKEGFENLKPSKNYDNLYKSALCRAKADWLVGLNLTRLYTVKNKIKLTIGRCQTATLNMIVSRHNEVLNFVSTKCYQIEGEFDNNLTGVFYKNGQDCKFKDKNIIQNYMNSISNNGKITKLEKKSKTKNRPRLYNLNELQKEANKKYGFTAKETLEIAQALYEKHKITTYPRTNSRYLNSVMEDKIKGYLLDIVENEKLDYNKHINELIDNLCIDENVIDDEKIEDHHALIVTENIKNYDIDKLNEKEKIILNMIIIRMILAVSQKQRFDETTIEIQPDNSNDIFKINGKNITFEGWKKTERELLGACEEEKEISEFKFDKQLGDKVEITNKFIKEINTTPPKLYTEGSILEVMENVSRLSKDKAIKDGLAKGIGTSATRADILENLIKVGYVKREKKNLIPTELGIKLINAVPHEIKSIELTANWENELKEIELGHLKEDTFIKEISEFVKKIIEYENKNLISIEVKKEEKEVIGICPKCGKNIYESKRNFYCEGFKDNPKCNFSLWKEDKFFTSRGKKITKSIAKNLISNGQAKVKFKKKDKSGEYEAIVKIKENGSYINFELEYKN